MNNSARNASAIENFFCVITTIWTTCSQKISFLHRTWDATQKLAQIAAHGHQTNGNNTPIEGEPITYEDFGKGILIVPSGLAYRNAGTNGIAPNDNLLFYVSLLDFVKDTDHDNDGTPSIQEDSDGDGDPRNDFSDENFPAVPDYLNPNIK